MLAGESFGDSGKEVVIEEFLEGEEASLHLICSGESFVAMPMSQDHKKVGEGDTGLNTGGMGAYAPTQLVTQEMLAGTSNLLSVQHSPVSKARGWIFGAPCMSDLCSRPKEPRSWNSMCGSGIRRLR